MSNIFALIDCDSFFVSCEQAKDPTLKKKPVCVTGGINGCVVSRSKEAKEKGVPMGYPVFMAQKEFKDVIYIEGDHQLYKEYSSRVMSILKDFSPNVEICSIDEAYVDFTGLCKLYRLNYYDLACYLREKILTETDIPVSIGVSSTKTLAKFASDYAKHTGGVYLIGKSKLKKLLPKTKVEEICGVGRRMKTALNKEGILTCQEFVNKSDEWLKNKFSITYAELRHELLADSIYKISTEYKMPKSIQETSSFAPATNDKDFLKNELNKHIKDACRKLRRHNARVFQLGAMLKTKDFIVKFEKTTCQKSLNLELDISKVIFELFEKIHNENELYRSTGVYFGNLISEDAVQIGLFDDNKDILKNNLSKSIDRIEAKFGKGAIKTGFL